MIHAPDHHMETKHDWDCLLVKAAGLALFTVACTWLPQAFGAVTQLVVGTYMGDKLPREFQAFQMQMTAISVGHVVSFVALLLLARWVFGYPKILQKALRRVDEA
jgi:hypothetical protein